MIVGIDLGTTNSLIAVWENDKPQLIPNSHGSFLTPSIVSLDPSGHIIVGKPVSNLYLSNFKRYMGTNKVLKLGDQTFRPEELSALVLKSLITDAEAYLKTKITEAVITVPAYFNDMQRKATHLAGELAGISVERLLNEPTAAAIAYGLNNRDTETQFLIFDLGGGTFDVSIVEIFEGVIEVRSSAGDNHLGGEDFTDLLEAYLKHEIEKKYQIGEVHQWRREIQAALHRLTDTEETVFSIEGTPIEIVITRSQFDRLMEPLMARIKAPLEKALRDARIHPHDLDAVIMVGGATRMPLMGSEVAKLFGKFPYAVLHPDEAIALGAAVQASLKERHADLKDVVVTDVCPFSLGTDVVQGEGLRFYPIIERNTTIPTSRVERLYTVSNNQTLISIGIYQGESYQVEENVKIGELPISVPPRPAGQESIDVRYTYDINGLLEVDVTVVSTGKQKKMVVNNQNHQLSESDIVESLKKLAHLKVHPRDQLENRNILSELKRLFELHKGDLREEVVEMVGRFNQSLDTQDPTEIEFAQTVAADFIATYKDLFQ